MPAKIAASAVVSKLVEIAGEVTIGAGAAPLRLDVLVSFLLRPRDYFGFVGAKAGSCEPLGGNGQTWLWVGVGRLAVLCECETCK